MLLTWGRVVNDVGRRIILGRLGRMMKDPARGCKSIDVQ